MKRRIGLFYQIAPVLKSTGHFFIKGALIQGHKIGQRRRAIEALETRAPPQYCDCGPDWPLLFKVHEI